MSSNPPNGSPKPATQSNVKVFTLGLGTNASQLHRFNERVKAVLAAHPQCATILDEVSAQLDGGEVGSLALPMTTLRPSENAPLEANFVNTAAGRSAYQDAASKYDRSVVNFNSTQQSLAQRKALYHQATSVVRSCVTIDFYEKLERTVPEAKLAYEQGNVFTLLNEIKKFSTSHDSGGCNAVRFMKALQTATALTTAVDGTDLMQTSKNLEDEFKNLFHQAKNFTSEDSQKKFIAAVRVLTLSPSTYTSYYAAKALLLSSQATYDEHFPPNISSVVAGALQSAQVLAGSKAKRKHEGDIPKVQQGQYGQAPTGPNHPCSNCGKMGHEFDTCWAKGGGGENSPDRPADFKIGGRGGGWGGQGGRGDRGGRGGRGDGRGRGRGRDAGRGGRGRGGRGQSKTDTPPTDATPVPPGSTKTQFQQKKAKGLSVRFAPKEDDPMKQDASEAADNTTVSCTNESEDDKQSHIFTFEHPISAENKISSTRVLIGIVVAVVACIVALVRNTTYIEDQKSYTSFQSRTTETCTQWYESMHDENVQFHTPFDSGNIEIPSQCYEYSYTETSELPTSAKSKREKLGDEGDYVTMKVFYMAMGCALSACVHKLQNMISQRRVSKIPRAHTTRLAPRPGQVPRVNYSAAETETLHTQTSFDCGAQITIFEKNEKELDHHRACDFGNVEGIGGTKRFRMEAWSHFYGCWGMWDENGTLSHSLLCLSAIEKKYNLDNVKCESSGYDQFNNVKAAIRYMTFELRTDTSQKLVFERMMEGPDKDLLVLLKEVPLHLRDEYGGGWYDEVEEVTTEQE